jgi:fucose 4-O-acetylase-like acetyltransferase
VQTLKEVQYKPYTIYEVVTMIYENNLDHFEFMDNMNGGDCDCNLHTTIKTIVHYWGEDNATD